MSEVKLSTIDVLVDNDREESVVLDIEEIPPDTLLKYSSLPLIANALHTKSSRSPLSVAVAGFKRYRDVDLSEKYNVPSFANWSLVTSFFVLSVFCEWTYFL